MKQWNYQALSFLEGEYNKILLRKKITPEAVRLATLLYSLKRDLENFFRIGDSITSEEARLRANMIKVSMRERMAEISSLKEVLAQEEDRRVLRSAARSIKEVLERA